MDTDDIVTMRFRRVSEQMLNPYTMPENDPYLSDEQRELCGLTFNGRIEWMAEWLELASSYQEMPPVMSPKIKPGNDLKY